MGELGVGLDIGGTRIKGGLVTAAGEVRARGLVAVGGERGHTSVLDQAAALVEELRRGAEAPLQRVGLAVAGVLDRASGLVRESPNFPAWRDVALGRELEARIGLPVSLDNDANAVILGEALAGAGRGASSLFGLTLGTGVGGGIVLDGELWRGERGMAGELGHLIVDPAGPVCGCGGRGCLEQYAGSLGLRRRLEGRGGEHGALAGHPDAPRLLAERAREGDAFACELWADAGRALGLAIAGLVHALDVQRVVLAGGLSGAADLFLPDLERTLEERMFSSMREGLEVVVGTLGEDAGVIGAALGAAET